MLSLIPARGGSKGVHRKNLRLVGGKPLIAWSIEVALSVAEIKRVIVSTDDAEIARISKENGAEVIMRPSEIASDTTPMIMVIEHLLDSLETHIEKYDYFLLLQPTSPARISSDITDAYQSIKHSGAESLISVCIDPDKNPARAYKIEKNCLVPYEKEPSGSLRQDLNPVYHRNGAIYLSRIEYIRQYRRLWSEFPQAYVMPKERSLNIDDSFDLLIADLLLTYLHKTS